MTTHSALWALLAAACALTGLIGLTATTHAALVAHSPAWLPLAVITAVDAVASAACALMADRTREATR